MADEIECRDEYNIKEDTMPILAFTFIMTPFGPNCFVLIMWIHLIYCSIC